MMPFPGGVENIANGTLIFSVLLAVFYGMIVHRAPSLRRTIVKTGSVVLLAALAAIEGGPTLLVAALALSAVGDACLAQDGEGPFLAGLASFLLTHIAYVGLFWTTGGGIAEIVSQPSRIVIALTLLAAVGLILSRLWPAIEAAMRPPVALYCVAILAMGLSSLSDLGAAVVAGAVLFMASDAILAAGRFLVPHDHPRQNWMRPLVWLLYYTSQLVLTLSFIAG
ncbi:MAG: lysoplasmalogenase [Mesorhizobium sp.]|nr:lysoplasmalogenase [Mesorhizobium sp.]